MRNFVLASSPKRKFLAISVEMVYKIYNYGLLAHSCGVQEECIMM